MSSVVNRVVAKSVQLVPWPMRDRIRRLPGIAQLQRIILRHTLEGEEFDHEINAGPASGLKLHVRLPEDKLYWTGTYELSTTQRLAAEVPRGGTCYDIGGHHGYLAGVMAVRGAQSVYCFEPNPENSERIEALIELNPDLHILHLPFAVGSEDGTASFELMPESSMGKLSSSSFQSHEKGGNRLDVKVRSLDSLVKAGSIDPADFIKIDIEGAELEALEGARELVASHKPAFLIEIHSFELLRSCATWLEERDYSVEVIDRAEPIACAADFDVCHLLARAHQTRSARA